MGIVTPDSSRRCFLAAADAPAGGHFIWRKLCLTPIGTRVTTTAAAHKVPGLALGLAVGVCAFFAAAVAVPAQAKVLAKVNGVEITDEDMKLAMEDIGPGIPRQLEGKARETYLLDFLIDEQLVVQKAQADKLAETPDFAKRLAYLRDKALMETLLGKVAKDAATDAAIKQTYETPPKIRSPTPNIHAHHILVPTEEEAKAAEKRIKAGEDFAKVADRAVEGSGRQGRRSRLVHQGPHGAGILRGRFEDGAGPGFRSREIAVRLACHQARRKARQGLPAVGPGA